MDNEERNGLQPPLEPLEALWLNAGRDAQAEAAFLHGLSRQRVVTIVRQPPGTGPAEPGHNLVQWRRTTDGVAFVPIFTSVRQLPVPVPPPAKAVRVPIRLLLAAVDGRCCIVNPLSHAPFTLEGAHVARLLDYMANAHQEIGNPSRTAPWAFRLLDDALFGVAIKLAEWFNQHGRVDRAYLYELLRGDKPKADIVLGLDQPADTSLADTLTSVAIEAGVDPAHFIVRFLPDEAAHREGVLRGGITPFYQRPTSPFH